MERLTQWTPNGASLILGEPKSYEEAQTILKAQFKKACNRLAELEDKLVSGQLVEMPCKVGDTVWYVNTTPSISLAINTVYEGHVARFYILNYPQPLGTVVGADIQIHNRYGTTEVLDIKDLGKSWFLTMKQAEARLKELKGQP